MGGPVRTASKRLREGRSGLNRGAAEECVSRLALTCRIAQTCVAERGESVPVLTGLMNLRSIEVGLVGQDPSVFETFERAQVVGIRNGRLMIAFEAGTQLTTLPASAVDRLDIAGVTSEVLEEMGRAQDGRRK